MLEIIDYNKDEYSFPCLVVLGCFDAIHEGHRELFKRLSSRQKETPRAKKQVRRKN